MGKIPKPALACHRAQIFGKKTRCTSQRNNLQYSPDDPLPSLHLGSGTILGNQLEITIETHSLIPS